MVALVDCMTAVLAGFCPCLTVSSDPCGTGTEEFLLTFVGLPFVIAGLATIFLLVGSLDFRAEAESAVLLPC